MKITDRIIRLKQTTRFPDSTYGDTIFNSGSVIYGYNEAIDDVLRLLAGQEQSEPTKEVPDETKKVDCIYNGHEKWCISWLEENKYCNGCPNQHRNIAKNEPTKDIPDNMIEKWAENNYHLKGLFNAHYDIRLLIEGAKAMQSGEIAHWAKENE